MKNILSLAGMLSLVFMTSCAGCEGGQQRSQRDHQQEKKMDRDRNYEDRDSENGSCYEDDDYSSSKEKSAPNQEKSGSVAKSQDSAPAAS